jgi:hypothetical protein
MFHFPTFPPHTLCVQVWVTGHDSCRVSPFGHPRINARLTAPRGLSQPPTSFFGSWCQGIHRAPLLTWPQRCSRPLCSSQGAGGPGRGVAACASRGAGAPSGARPVLTVGVHRRPALRAGGRCTAVPRGQMPAPSGPNSVPTAGSGSPDDAFHAPRGSTSAAATAAAELVSVPPMSNHAGMRIRPWLWTVSRPPGAP